MKISSDFKIKWVEEIGSTNDELKRQSDSLDNFSILAARYQSRGKGQRGNVWTADSGKNLTFSILVKPGQDGVRRLGADNSFELSQITALSVCQCLMKYNLKSRIKWPNDIYIDDKKICGILIENRYSVSDISSSVIGIGLNVNQKEFDPELPNPVSMSLVSGKEYDLNEILSSFADCFHSSVFLDSEELKTEYRTLLYRSDKAYGYIDTQTLERFSATIENVLPNGHIRLKDSDGRIREYEFKQVAFVL